VQRKSLMEYLSLIEREPSAHGASAHFLVVAHACGLSAAGRAKIAKRPKGGGQRFRAQAEKAVS